MSEDPLHIPPDLRAENVDYQWFSVNGTRNPADGGWKPVSSIEMPGFQVEFHELRLFQRPLSVTEHVREQEKAVAEQLVAGARDVMPRPVVAKIVSSPLGPSPLGWSLRRWFIYLAIRWIGRHSNSLTERLVSRFCQKSPRLMERWAEHNHLSMFFYIELHAEAIVKGKGRWLGPIVTGRYR